MHNIDLFEEIGIFKLLFMKVIMYELRIYILQIDLSE